ncbi:hypothetical protein [Xanthomonas phage DES1]|nr:hypothetical protein [Xanthomonas phage DES1]
MYPEDKLSSQAAPGSFLFRTRGLLSPMIDYERGGVALRDPSQGLSVKDWKVYIDGNAIYITDSINPAIQAFAMEGVTEVCLAFDANMNPFVGFVVDGVAMIWWYDSSIPEQIFSIIGEGVSNVRSSLDDNRSIASSYRDIILAYNRNGNLYIRKQRDRYEIEYLQAENTPKLDAVGMNSGFRFQFRYQPLDPFPFMYEWDSYIRYSTGDLCVNASLAEVELLSAYMYVYPTTEINQIVNNCGLEMVSPEAAVASFAIGLSADNPSENGWIEMLPYNTDRTLAFTVKTNISETYFSDNQLINGSYSYLLVANTHVVFPRDKEEDMTFRGLITVEV